MGEIFWLKLTGSLIDKTLGPAIYFQICLYTSSLRRENRKPHTQCVCVCTILPAQIRTHTRTYIQSQSYYYSLGPLLASREMFINCWYSSRRRYVAGRILYTGPPPSYSNNKQQWQQNQYAGGEGCAQMVGIRILFFKFWMPDPEISTAKSYTHAKPICTHTRIVEGIYRIIYIYIE